MMINDRINFRVTAVAVGKRDDIVFKHDGTIDAVLSKANGIKFYIVAGMFSYFSRIKFSVCI